MFGSEKLMYNEGNGFYPKTLDGSLRFNDADTAYLSRTPSTAGNRKTWTFSAWVKRGNIGSSGDTIFLGGDNSNNAEFARLWFFDTLRFSYFNDYWFITNRVFRDASAWYHICLKFDTTQAVASDRITLYVNGIKVSDFSIENYPAQNSDQGVNFNDTHYIGASSVNSSIIDKFDGYMSEVHFTDGTAYDADAFGEFKSGVWVAKEPSVTYGTNGFYLPLSSDSNDDSGNGNNWTQNNLASTDFVLDSPTNNFATLNPLDGGTVTQQGNLAVAVSGSTGGYSRAGFGITGGNWYFEASYSGSISTNYPYIGLTGASGYITWNPVGNLNNNGSSSTITTWSSGDLLSISIDYDGQSAGFYKNGALVHTQTNLTWLSDEVRPTVYSSNSLLVVANFGQDSSFAGNKTPQGNTDANGIGDFYYAPPTGYLALCTANLPEPAFSPADDESPQDHFNTVVYNGTGTEQGITGVGFQPDFLWIKNRILANPHITQNVITGADTHLQTSSTGAEQTDTTLALSFDTDGFTVGSNQAVNESSRSYVAWNWKANGSGVSNTDGSITSTVSANVDAGFSIVSYTGTGVTTETVGHGLQTVPDMIIVKNRDTSTNNGHWVTYHQDLNANKQVSLNLTIAEADSSAYYGGGINTSPTSSVFSFANGSANQGNVNELGDNYIAYCFHSVDGFSKFGSYTGNGSADGPFIYTGFRPAFVLIKRIDSAQNWTLSDYKRSPENIVNKQLYPSATVAELNESDHDYLSNGFKIRNSGGNMNANGGTYIYMAFAENPFKYANAR